MACVQRVHPCIPSAVTTHSDARMMPLVCTPAFAVPAMDRASRLHLNPSLTAALVIGESGTA